MQIRLRVLGGQVQKFDEVGILEYGQRLGVSLLHHLRNLGLPVEVDGRRVHRLHRTHAGGGNQRDNLVESGVRGATLAHFVRPWIMVRMRSVQPFSSASTSASGRGGLNM